MQVLRKILETSRLTTTSPSPRGYSPILRIAAGLIVVLAGLLIYLGVNLGLSFALVLVLAGVLVVAIGIFGRRVMPVDIALFIIALIIFAGAASSVSYPASSTKIYTVARSQISVSRIAIEVNSNFGSISVRFSGNVDLGYQVKFTRTQFAFPFSFPIFGNNTISLTNMTDHGTLFLTANASTAGISITLGPGFLVSINGSTGTGSVDVTSNSRSQMFGAISLSTGTGSVSSHIDSQGVSSIDLSTGTGSVSFASTYLSPSRTGVPLTLSTGTGSLSFNARLPTFAGANISATDGFGVLSNNLTGFNILQSNRNQLIATEGKMLGPSFDVSLSVGTGSMDVVCSISNQTG